MAADDESGFATCNLDTWTEEDAFDASTIFDLSTGSKFTKNESKYFVSLILIGLLDPTGVGSSEEADQNSDQEYYNVTSRKQRGGHRSPQEHATKISKLIT